MSDIMAIEMKVDGRDIDALNQWDQIWNSQRKKMFQPMKQYYVQLELLFGSFSKTLATNGQMLKFISRSLRYTYMQLSLGDICCLKTMWYLWMKQCSMFKVFLINIVWIFQSALKDGWGIMCYLFHEK